MLRLLIDACLSTASRSAAALVRWLAPPATSKCHTCHARLHG